ncbi:glycosyltransferase family 4 protein [Frankia sp. Ag45/Mut15]|uniref:Glycosyltransferase family 4 protein n=1 Tax=Frankia umida TaxID=573489 RepID=A0ABT0JVV9_9ACTN|nr:glycosyltransferase family 4 protein [Frankia umida]MCK9875685.1 glycosyltransferase family 4 protein [Frankia umida]
MKILHVTKRYPNATGGDAFVVSGLEREQRAAGHDVVILTSRNAEISDAPHVIKFGAALTAQEIDVLNARRVLTMAALAVRAPALLRRVRPDVIHVHTVDLGVALSLAARMLRIPTVITLHGTTVGKATAPKAKRLLESALLVAGRYRRVISMDPSSFPALRSLRLGRRLAYVPNGIDVTDLAVHEEPTPVAAAARTVLFVGRLEPIKGLVYLLSAFATVVRQVPDARLELVGDGAQREDLAALAQELGIAESVHFVGRRDRAQLSRGYREAAVFVLPSLHEGFPLVLLEAWAHGAPVVTTRVGAMADVCVSGVDSLVVSPADAGELATAISQVLRDPGVAEKIAAGGQARMAAEGEFTPSAVAAGVARVYELALAERRPAWAGADGTGGGAGTVQRSRRGQRGQRAAVNPDLRTS